MKEKRKGHYKGCFGHVNPPYDIRFGRIIMKLQLTSKSGLLVNSTISHVSRVTTRIESKEHEKPKTLFDSKQKTKHNTTLLMYSSTEKYIWIVKGTGLS